MKVAKDIFKLVWVMNLIVYCIFVPAEMSGLLSRMMWYHCEAIMAASMVILAGFSIAFLFIDRRLAGRGFLVLLVGFIICLLFPEL
jgi:hypothetical protein